VKAEDSGLNGGRHSISSVCS